MAPRIGARSIDLEIGRQKVFACSLEWPGWARAARSEAQAHEQFAEYATRYGAVATEAGIPFDPERLGRFEIVERLPGNASTDFGAPDSKPAADLRSLTAAGAERLAALVASSWVVFDRVVADSPQALRKGPRGGGRDRDRIVEHVFGAEAGYVRMIGLKLKQPDLGDRKNINQFRDEVLTMLRAARSSDPATKRGWPPRYAFVALRGTCSIMRGRSRIGERRTPGLRVPTPNAPPITHHSFRGCQNMKEEMPRLTRIDRYRFTDLG